MAIAGAALTKVAAAAESTVRYGSVPQGTSDEAFLTLATSHDPTLVAPLAEYQVRATYRDRHALVLLCTADGSSALIEDAGCTAKSDVPQWRQSPLPSCDFTLDLRNVCGR